MPGKKPLVLKQTDGTPLEGLSAREIEAARLLAEGLPWGKATFIAAGWPEKSAMTRSSEFKNRPEPKYRKFREAVRYLIDTRLLSLSAKALTTLEDLLDSNHPQTRARAAADILDRTGFNRESVLNVHHTDDRPQSLEQLREELARELAKLPPAERQLIASQLSEADRQAIERRQAIDVHCEPAPTGDDEALEPVSDEADQ